MPNNTPIADAGPDFLWSIDLAVPLDGTGSHDPDGDPLTYQWTFSFVPPGSPLTDEDIENADSPEASFLPHVFGEFMLRLEVSDGAATATDTVSVSAKDNVPPSPDAGEDQVVFLGDTVLLDGRFSGDIDGDALDYIWSFLSVPEASKLSSEDISSQDSVLTLFQPDVVGVYEVELEADDAFFTATDSMEVVVEPAGCACSSSDLQGGSFVALFVLAGALLLRRA